MATHMGRQVVLGRTQVHLLIDDMVLRHRLGDPTMMHAQLQHLAALTSRANVTVQVIPHDVAAHPGMGGPFLVLDFQNQPTLVYVESRGTSTFLEEDDHIDSARVARQRLRALALSPEDSAWLIAEIAGKLT